MKFPKILAIWCIASNLVASGHSGHGVEAKAEIFSIVKETFVGGPTFSVS